jgi:di/tripeptidase
MQAIHSKHEWIAVNDMEQSAGMLVELVKVWEQQQSV